MSIAVGRPGGLGDGPRPGSGARVVIGNWKAGCRSVADATLLARELSAELSGGVGAVVAVCPSFTALAAVRDGLGAGILLGAQDVFWEDQGAYTGEVTGPMLADLGCTYAIVGHSERRRLCAETDEAVARKLLACRRSGLVPVLCVGESLEQREAGLTDPVLRAQVEAALRGAEPGPLAIAYEPVWAIGTGRAATEGDCAAGLAVIREAVARVWPAPPPVPCLYGGSVTPRNCAGFWNAGGADGALVGGASLQARDFAAICRTAAEGRGSGA